jgi:hypothetical protein
VLHPPRADNESRVLNLRVGIQLDQIVAFLDDAGDSFAIAFFGLGNENLEGLLQAANVVLGLIECCRKAFCSPLADAFFQFMIEKFRQ